MAFVTGCERQCRRRGLRQFIHEHDKASLWVESSPRRQCVPVETRKWSSRWWQLQRRTIWRLGPHPCNEDPGSYLFEPLWGLMDRRQLRSISRVDTKAAAGTHVVLCVAVAARGGSSGESGGSPKFAGDRDRAVSVTAGRSASPRSSSGPPTHLSRRPKLIPLPLPSRLTSLQPPNPSHVYTLALRQGCSPRGQELHQGLHAHPG